MSNRSLSDAINLIPALKTHSLLGNLKHSSFYHSLTSLEKTKLWSRFYVDDENASNVLDILSTDQKIITNPRSSRTRRTVVLKKNTHDEFGFTIQTYILKKSLEEALVKVSYIDYVHFEGPAADAGIRPGDVIISINGLVVTEMSHNELIALIGSCREMRMILVFENIRERIQLAARAIRLRKLLNDKLYQLNLIDIEEQNILNRAYARAIASRRNIPLTSSLCSYESSMSSRATSDSLLCRNDDSIDVEMRICSSQDGISKGYPDSSISASSTADCKPSDTSSDIKDSGYSDSAVNLSFEDDYYPTVTRL